MVISQVAITTKLTSQAYTQFWFSCIVHAYCEKEAALSSITHALELI